MAQALTPTQLADAFRRWGVTVVEPAGWAEHHRGGSYGDMHGILIHHTGDDASDDADFRVLWNGRADLAGPLCTWGTRDDGTVVMVGGGRANHAGLGSSQTLGHLEREDYTGNLAPGRDDTDGNAVLYGQETMYSGGHPMTLAALQSTVRCCAAVCEAHTLAGVPWTGKSVIGHKEWTGRKVDPGSIVMADLRALVDVALATGPGWTLAGAPVPAPLPAQPAPPAGQVVVVPGVPAPPFPLPRGSYFGPRSGPASSVSGFYSHREDLRRWQRRMAERGWRLDADGLYGDATATVARGFQAEKGLAADGLIGPETWAAAWTAPTTR